MPGPTRPFTDSTPWPCCGSPIVKLKVTVNTGTDAVSTVNDGLKIGNKDNFIDVLAIGEDGTFTVTVEFVDESYSFVNGVLSSANDAAERENLEFDLVVYAVQVTTEPTP